MRSRTPARLGLVLLLGLVACARGPHPPAVVPETAPVCSTPDHPASLADVKAHLRAYHASGAYDAAVTAVVREAGAYVAGLPADGARRAIVLDIDETALSNWTGLEESDFGFVPRLWNEWLMRGQATAIRPTVDLFRLARERGYGVFFVTGRPESQRAVTERNLRQAGYTDWDGLLMRPDGDRRSAAELKAPIRCGLVAQGWDIVANLGDQPSDLAGGCADRAFRVPNPFYLIP
ncbi:MAG TPA: HAD family acid phosphatase [Candidatus Binatia bacterium]|nr:HAD family acid phosphatase [Candidatus Binatia bacterium]